MNKPDTLARLIDFAAEKYADKDFCRYISEGKLCTRSFDGFRQDALSVCRYIKEYTPDTLHIAFAGKTGYEYIACLTGMILSGNVVVPFDPAISPKEACFLFDDADIDILFCDEEFLPVAEEIRSSLPGLKKIISLGDSRSFNIIFNKYASPEYSHLSPVYDNPERPALIIYTSGTTGTKKGVVLSDGNLCSNSTYDTYTMAHDDVSFSILPMHHIFCYSCDVLKTLYDGGTICLNGKMEDIYTNFLIFEPTVMRIVPSLCRSILTRIKIAEKRNKQMTPREAAQSVTGRRMERMIAGSAFLSANLIDEFAKYGISARQGYGMSECSPRITTADFSDNCRYSNGILTGVDEVRVADGEIQVRGPSVMQGYYKREKETKEAFTDDGFFHTGDTGYIENNHIYLTGRKKNVIILSNGENISPEEIENKYADEDTIKEIIVFADGDILSAEIYPEDNVSREDIQIIIDRINISSPADRHIQTFSLREKPFPKTSTGKIKRQEFFYERSRKE